MTTALWPTERNRFSPRDETRLADAMARLERHGWKVRELSGALFDCREFTPPFAAQPSLFLLREADGTYRLLDHRLRVLREGSTLENVAPAGWIEAAA